MKCYRKYIILVLAVLLLASCSQQKEDDQKTSGLTIEPLELNKKEKVLINKTGVNFIRYFKLNGHLKKNEDLKIELDKYVNGKKTDESMSSTNEPNLTFQDDILSFGIQTLQEEKKLILFMGLTNGISSTTESKNKITASSYGNVLNKKIKLIKESPVYLAAWMGTSKNEIHGGFEDEEGKFPDAVKQSELAFVYKITLVHREK
ncbi:hypothetical protein AN964_12450 [Heyndrickxia shackletonii]|uniref:Lipoprotein n=1 Tax=Heyndrickxia shackletonii TaxID=157838 RepID=A0A0Q3TJR5_9BACI|nr:hypothetical protein [Heyndrickxia shackletonii]KQL54224.1 hypothetical protein AN964_12450 [Heyndrickxia shackletonii]NEZ00903.1 hypothetical protein [Heyndrickxia shackletonii]